MEKQKVDMFLTANAKNFPTEKIEEVKTLLSNADDSKEAMINSLGYKSPMTMMLIAWFLGSYGVDRFMLKDKNAIWKLLTCGGCGIWAIVDIFSAQSRTREFNYNLLKQALS